MKRILLLSHDFLPEKGGVARYLDALATEFRDNILVLAETGENSSEFDAVSGYPIVRERLFYGFFWPKWLKSFFILCGLKDKFDILVVSHVFPFGLVALLSRIFLKKDYAVIFHGLDYRFAKRSAWKKFWLKLIIQNAKFLVTNSNWLKAEISGEHVGKKIIVVYPCLTSKLLHKPDSKETKPDSKIKLITVARLVQRKGHLRVLDALKKLDSALSSGIEYAIVGDGKMKSAIQEKISEFGLEKVAEIKTNVSDRELANEYETSDIFIMPVVDLPFDREGFGIVYLEAAAFGLPAIATRLPGVDEAVIDGKTGILVEDGNIQALAEAISELARDPERRKRLGEQGRERALQEFTREKQFGKLKPYFE